MVQKYTAPIRVFKYPFELVMAAYEKRFPTCHLIPVFVGSDIIYDNISQDGSIHVIERRCQIAIDAPYLLRKIAGVDEVLFIQKNTLNRRKRVLKIEAKNESFSNHINIHELCFYRVSPDNENWTIFEQQASLEIKSFWGFEHVVEKLAVKHYSQNIKKGEEIIEYHIKELAQEGITHVPKFESTTTTILNSRSDGELMNHINDNDHLDDNDGDDEDGDHFIDSSSTLFKNLSINNSNSNNNNNHKIHNNGTISKKDETSSSKPSKSKFDFRSNSVEEKIQATKQKILNKCEKSLNKKNKNSLSFENNTNSNTNTTNTNSNSTTSNGTNVIVKNGNSVSFS